MRLAIRASALVFALALAGGPAAAQQQAAPAAPAAPQSAPAAAAHYSTADTDIGTLLDDPAARAILARHLPELVSNEQINMARSMTLRAIQSYSSDVVTDAKLAQIDAELAQLPARH